MLDLRYLGRNFAKIVDERGFYKGKKDTTKVRLLQSICKSMFGIENVRMNITDDGGEEIYRFDILGKKKLLIGTLYYLPITKRIDVWTTADTQPLIQLKDRHVVSKNYPEMLDVVGLDKLFNRLLNVL